MQILVTGAAGFIGSHVAEALARAGHRVIGLDSFNDFYDRSLKEDNAAAASAAGAELLRLDLATADLGAAVRGADAVIHLAAQPGLSEKTTFDDYVRNNVVATGRLLAAIDAAGSATRFVHVSTSSVYGAEATGDETTLPAPTSVYGATKLAAEQLVLARHRESALGAGSRPRFEACSLRIFSVYGPRERPDKFYARLIRAILTDREIPMFEGSEHHRRSFSFVSDIVAGVLAPLDRWEVARGEVFNIGTDVDATTGEGLAIVERLTGKRARITRLPRRSGDQLRTLANIAKARRLLEYAPSTTLEAGLAAELAWIEGQLRKA